MEEEQPQNKLLRVFVGGLGEAVTTEDLRRLFGSLGTVEAVETIRTKGRSFAYVDFLPSPTDDKSLSKLFSKYNGCLWKGGKLKLEKAKGHYLTRLKREWDEEAEADLVSSRPMDTDVGADKLLEKPTKESLKAKQLHIFFPRLRKVKSIPFLGTGKHKYSFQNIKVPPMPVHFCDCEEHCSPIATEKGKQYVNRATEIGGMNDDEVNIMNAVMNKLLGKEKVSNEKHLEKEQDSLESPDAVPHDELEVDSATDEDDIIININTKKNKSALSESQELELILENQALSSSKTRKAKEEPNKSMLDGHKSPNKKIKSLPTLERERNGRVPATAGGKSNIPTISDELGSDAQTTDSEDDSGELTKVSWSQKSSWKELLGGGGKTAFSASLILPKSDSDKEQRRSDSPSPPSSTNHEIESMGSDDESLGSEPSDTEVIEDLTEAEPTDTEVIEVLAEAEPTDTEVREEEHAEAQPTNKSVAPNKITGCGASWRLKQSWTQLVSADNNSFSISQILPDISFPDPMTKEPTLELSSSSGRKHDVVAKDTTNGVVSDVFKSGETVPEKSKRVGANDIASAPKVEKKIETKPRERSSEETSPKERSTAKVEIGETCTFMRSSESLKEWAKAKAAMSGSLKRKRGEK